NVEIQKVGYRFPGQRSACYSSDLIIRQYDRQKSRKKKKFSYRDLQKVYTIVLVENSSAEFHRIPNQYIHRSSQKFDTGLELELLQEYIFIALDIFREITHNIDKELDAWLYFLSSDEPEDIKRVIEAYPAFLELYREIAEFQRRPEELIAMYNETLALFDKNTVELMIEEQQEEIKKLAEEVRNKKAELEQSKTELEQSKADQREKDKELRRRDEELARLRREIERLGGNAGE
ncbi:MAG: PD-(D/E)XK nuclease family transposase, partial [Hungatella sp.]